MLVDAKKRTGSVMALLLLPVLGCSSSTQFRSRVPYEPLLDQLKNSGGDPSLVVHVASSRELLRLEAGQRYKFALERGGVLVVAPAPAVMPHNDYVHPVLVGGRAVSTAGGITVEHANGNVMQVKLDQDSKAYCPTFASLDEAARYLTHIGLTTRQVVKEDRPPTCATPQN